MGGVVFDFGFEPERIIKVVKKGEPCEGVGFFIGRGSALGNPYSHKPSKHSVVKVGNREEAIKSFKDDLLSGSLEPEAYKLIDEIKEAYKTSDVTLICYCKPLACHGDVIRKYVLGGYNAK